MCGRASPSEPETPGPDPADFLRQAIERNWDVLVRRLTVLVYRVCGRLRREEVQDRVVEVLNEAVRRALQNAAAFDPARSATAWIMGIALRVLQEQRRTGRRTVVQSDLGDAVWRGALEELCSADDSQTATIRLDIRQALARLDESQRRIIQLRYTDGLDGEELARELNAPTAGAARVRLARALQALRAAFGPSGDEEQP
ncbi:MAG TPA: sigma-70 family RNA polymerase sigma factor [Gemmataceae bacterium]|nr:sigma-70 family RNA polymerase sigma factor [Gemmataceae bacterium]